jgi:hypothetical protein
MSPEYNRSFLLEIGRKIKETLQEDTEQNKQRALGLLNFAFMTYRTSVLKEDSFTVVEKLNKYQTKCAEVLGTSFD